MSKPSARAMLPVDPKEITWNPSAEELRRLTEEMPNTRITRYNNTNTQTRVDARSKLSTYVVTDTPERHDSQTITREEYQRVAKLQNEYILRCEMVLVDGFIGNDPNFRVPARLIIERSNANVAG
ncbi:MAG TPA: phosphoenolpyruvate carboxykinase (ATP), partial [Blastocatellia bacterium]|nr:phosphoenolpyruvate carboxykinase (ATP) [Blastocatellia bacterium]